MTTLSGGGAGGEETGVGETDVFQFLSAFREGAAPVTESEPAPDGWDAPAGVATQPPDAPPVSPVPPPDWPGAGGAASGAAGGPGSVPSSGPGSGPSWGPGAGREFSGYADPIAEASRGDLGTPAAPPEPVSGYVPWERPAEPAPWSAVTTGGVAPTGWTSTSTLPSTAGGSGPAARELDRRRMRERISMAAVLAVTATVLSLVAVHNNDAATKWRRLDQAQIQISTGAGRQVQTANANISQLNAEVKSLQSQVSSMQGQLSSVANQKEKAIDQTTVFKDLLAAAGEVTNNLQECISATDQLDSDVNAAVAAGDLTALGSLQVEASAVHATCARAQQGNDALQSAIQSAS